MKIEPVGPSPSTRRPLPSVAVAAPRLLLTVLVLAATVAPAAEPGRFLETLDVRVVNLEVYVTDRNGRQVEGLEAHDFTLLEDGKRVPLEHFSFVGGAGDETVAAELPAAAHIVLFFDNFAIQPQGRKLILDELGPLLAGELPADTLWAVASYDGYLRIHQPFTRDGAAIAAAIAECGRLSPLGVLRQAERDAAVRQGLETLRTVLQLAGDEDRRDLAARRLRGFTQQLDAESERQRQLAQATVFAMSHLVNSLAALPGRKAFVYLGEGIPMRPGEELYAAIDELTTRAIPDLLEFETATPEQRDAELDRRSAALGAIEASAGGAPGEGRAATSGIQELTALANAGRVSFYALKTEVGDGGLPPEFAGEMRELFTPRLQGLRERNLTESIRAMAAETGGRAELGTGVGRLLAEARADLASYYFLGFEPDRPADGAYHQLEVKVKGRGLKLRHRTGYVDKPPIARVADRTTAAMLLGLEDDPLGVGVRFGVPAPGPEKGLWVVPVEVSVPLARLAGVAGGKLPAALYLATRDAEGRAAPVQQLPLELDPGAAGGVQTTGFRLLMRDGEQRLGLGLVVPAAGIAAFVSRVVEVGAAGAPADESGAGDPS